MLGSGADTLYQCDPVWRVPCMEVNHGPGDVLEDQPLKCPKHTARGQERKALGCLAPPLPVQPHCGKGGEPVCVLGETGVVCMP